MYICRGLTASGRRKTKCEEDLEEVLVPELCCLLEFPSVYLLKVTVIPSVMHRISLLLLAEELRIKIASEVGLGNVAVPQGKYTIYRKYCLNFVLVQLLM